MRPLLWKELHDLRAWLLAGMALAGTLALLVRTQVFNSSFVGTWMEALMPVSCAALCIALASGQVARERHGGTLDFLLVRPVDPSTIVWSKFLAGSLVLGLLLMAFVSLGYADSSFTKDTALQMIREQVRMGQLIAALLPRFWFLYALSLLFSVVADRSAKAAALGGTVVIVLVAAVLRFEELAPFSGFVYGLPFFDSAGGLVEAAKSPAISAITAVAFSSAAVLITAVSATLLKRSPGVYLGNRGLVLAGAGVIAVAIVSAHAAANRLPERIPAGTFSLQDDSDSGPAGVVAEGALAAVTSGPRVRFLDFGEPARPRQIADIKLPLWETSTDWQVDRAAIQDRSLFLTGRRKQLPVDAAEIAIVKPEGPSDAIPLGPVRAGDYISAPVPAGPVVYVGVTQDRVCSLLAFDLASQRQVNSIAIDRMRPPQPGRDEGSPPVRLLRRGNYLYISSPSYLTAVDIADRAHPVVTSQLAVRPKVSFLYGFPRPLAWQDGHLFEIRIFPESLASYDLADPAHPMAEAELTYTSGMEIAGSGHALYRPWESGVLEFRAEGNGLHAWHYLRGDGAVASMAIADNYVYTLTLPQEHRDRRVQAYRR
jgi:ABC-type transport system involved in multi-copper enzyme maturation permease subunit